MTIPFPSSTSTSPYNVAINSTNAALNRWSIPDGQRPQSRPASSHSGRLHLVARTAPVKATASGDQVLKQSGLPSGLQKLFRTKDGKDRGPRGPHPGDIIYWVTCLGAACLLLLAAT